VKKCNKVWPECGPKVEHHSEYAQIMVKILENYGGERLCVNGYSTFSSVSTMPYTNSGAYIAMCVLYMSNMLDPMYTLLYSIHICVNVYV
jgi:hypothetical protein